MAEKMEYLSSCPLCGGTLVLETRKLSIKYKGQETMIDQNGQYCDQCKEGFHSPKDLAASKRLITDFHRKVDNLLTTDELKAFRSKLRLSQKDASDLFGGGPMAFSKYERGEITQNKSTDRLIRLLVNGKIKVADIKAIDEEELEEM